MKVSNSPNLSVKPRNSASKLSKSDIQARIKARFGDKAMIKKKVEKPKVSDSVEITSKESAVIGDVAHNDPNSEITREKLRGILKSGGFDFNPKERSALADILNS